MSERRTAPKRRHAIAPILVFAVVSAFASPILAKLQDVLALNPDVLRLTVFSTAAGAAVVWLIWRKGLAYPPATTTGLTRPLLLGGAAFLLAGALAYGLARIESAPWPPPRAEAFGGPAAMFLIVQLAGAAAEEVGWRGLVQPLLEMRLTAWKAALVTGALFGAGHFYLAFAVSPGAFILFVVAAVAISLVLAAATLGRPWQGRIIVATLLHFAVNMETFFLFTDGDGSVLYFADMAAAYGVVGVVALAMLVRRGDAPGAIETTRVS